MVKEKTFMALTKLPSAGLNNSSVTSGKIPDNSLQDGKFANALLEFYLQNLVLQVLNLLLVVQDYLLLKKTLLKASNLTITGSSFVQFPEVTFVNQSTGVEQQLLL